ncbi:IS701 family transposase [Actinopolyspora mortivallis]|uniref:IS701 family transposase n=1 Tax=Actinopolyspora mortivallis TaxID=33906 RepID=UPI00037D129E|nr:transposase [Actinopolyspora mortivallis]
MNTTSVHSSELADELCSAAFSALRRSDQRRRGHQYVHGLLSTRGRRSIRNIAGVLGGAAAAQSLHHFVHSSTWDWMTVRDLLVRALRERVRPVGWVVRPLSIPKTGGHSVGVSTNSNSQYAFGLWMVTPGFSVPVNWRLFLAPEWVTDEDRRHQAGIPTEVRPESPAQCATSVLLEAVRRWGPLGAPVIFDGVGSAEAVSGGELAGAEFPFLMGTTPSLRCTVAEARLPGYGCGPVSAGYLLDSVRGLRRPVEWTDPDTGATVASSAVSAKILVAGHHHGTGGGADRRVPFRLVGEWEDPQRPPRRLWLTNAHTPPVETLVRSTRLTARVAADACEIGDAVGMRDFEGRSFPGWHRHVTLASIAHAARALARAEEGRSAQRTPLPA